MNFTSQGVFHNSFGSEFPHHTARNPESLPNDRHEISARRKGTAEDYPEGKRKTWPMTDHVSEVTD